MELDELVQLIATDTGDFPMLHEKITSAKIRMDDIQKFLKQYEPDTHDVADTSNRPDKIIEVEGGKANVKVARLPIPVQKRIVKLAAAFLCGNPIQFVSMIKDNSQTQQDMVDLITKVWEDNKLDYDSKNMAKKMFSETEVAEIWYLEDADPDYWADTVISGSKKRLRMKILANSLGDQLFPVFNQAGDMIAFGREYSVMVDNEAEKHFDLYTEDFQYLSSLQGEVWTTDKQANAFKKIQVIYYSQDAPLWADVQWLIDRFETLQSNHADTNDYFGSPTVIASGDVINYAKKGEQGKFIEVKEGGDVKYLTWDQSPASMKLEYDNLKTQIWEMTNTPEITPETMKGIGPLSGIALKMLFLNAHLGAADNEEVFGKGIQRRINFLKSAIATVSMKMAAAVPLAIKPKFEYYLPKNELEMIQLLNTATGGQPTMSQATAVENNPLVEDPEEELIQIQNEQQTQNQNPTNLPLGG